ncbi:MAG: biopolymer transporter ExbD, partial [Pirellulaceae bacterium]|nr:biopolymer transporter ExbD [Pirellulaceae bacterium]
MTDDSRILSTDEMEEMLLDDDQPALPRRPMKDDAELDITPMIDCVFLLLIFFIVSSKMDPSASVELPPAKYGGGVSDKTSFIITIAKQEGDLPASVYLADGA